MPESPSTVARRDLSALRIDRSGDPPPVRRRMPWWLLGAVALVGLVAGAWSWIRTLPAFAPEVLASPALVERAPTGARAVLSASGYVVARTKASVSAKTAGRLEHVAVEEGDRVEAGAILARLEAAGERAERDAARAALAAMEATLQRARAEAELAEIEERRQAELLTAEVGTPTARDQASATARARRAAVLETAAAVENARARLRQADVALEDRNVRAPFSGVVLRKEAEVGESVAPAVASGQLTRGAIVTMADLSELEVEADVAESNIARVIEGGASEIAVDAVPDRRYRGRVRQVMPTADRQKATVEVDVTILDADLRVKPEMGAKVTFLSGEPDAAALNAPPAVTAPADAIVPGSGGAFAWVVAGGRVTRARLELGERRGDRVVVAAGLSGGEMLVVSPPSRLDEGDVVRVTVR